MCIRDRPYTTNKSTLKELKLQQGRIYCEINHLIKNVTLINIFDCKWDGVITCTGLNMVLFPATAILNLRTFFPNGRKVWNIYLCRITFKVHLIIKIKKISVYTLLFKFNVYLL